MRIMIAAVSSGGPTSSLMFAEREFALAVQQPERERRADDERDVLVADEIHPSFPA